MNAAELKSIQAPLKDQYRNDPASANITLKAIGKIGEGISCKVETGKAVVEAGLHPATGEMDCRHVQVICYWKHWLPVQVLQ